MKLSPELEQAILNTPGAVVYGAKPLTQPEPADEKAFMAEVVALARRNGWAVMHHTISKKSAAGWPDLFMCRAGKAVVAELKTETGRTTADQERWIDLLREAGLAVYLWRPSSWQEIVGVLETMP